jgi:hypothetical protein
MISGLTTVLAAEATLAVRQQVRAAGWMAAGGVFALGAAATGLVALHQWLSTFMPSLHATLWIAGGLLAVAIALMIAGLAIKRARRPRSALNLTAVALAPAAARMAFSRSNIATFGVGGMLALGALLGRKLGK